MSERKVCDCHDVCTGVGMLIPNEVLCKKHGRGMDMEDRIAALEAENATLHKWQRYASYCKCCAESGEHKVMSFEEFVNHDKVT